jgi:hypothetical protein
MCVQVSTYVKHLKISMILHTPLKSESNTVLLARVKPTTMQRDTLFILTSIPKMALILSSLKKFPKNYPKLEFKQTVYTPAGFDLTTLSSSLHGDRRRQ